MVKWRGIKMSLGELCSKLNINKVRVYQRLTRDGMSLNDAIKKPLRKYPIKNQHVIRF